MTSSTRKTITILGGAILAILLMALVSYGTNLLVQRATGAGESAAPALAGAAGGRGTEPMIGFNYMLACPPNFTGYFSFASGPGSEHELVAQKIMGPGGSEIQLVLPGRLQYEPLVLGRGITAEMSLSAWRKLVTDGKIKEARVAGCEFNMLDQTGATVAQWRLANVWPSKLVAPADMSDYGLDDGFPMELVTLVYEGLERVK